MQNITKDELNKILESLPENSSESTILKSIKDYLFQSEYKKTLMTKSDQICTFLKTGSYKWIEYPNGEEKLVITCNLELITQEQLQLINDCILRFFSYAIMPIQQNNKVSIVFTENLSHKEMLRELFKVV